LKWLGFVLFEGMGGSGLWLGCLVKVLWIVLWLVEDRFRAQGWAVVTACGEVATRLGGGSALC
ncbi:hypothetical protein ACTOVQ_08075, partial [Arcanobacterium canis]